MTSRQVFEFALVELNKVQAPSLILEDYNYFLNKTVLQYINKNYNAYDINQQKSDDLRVLKATAVLEPTISTDVTGALLNKTYEVNLPDDYLHILNCLVEYNVDKPFKCYDTSTPIHFGAKRLTADMYSQIINNYYMRPSYKNPYFYINNVNVSNTYPTTDTQEDISALSDNYIKFSELTSAPNYLIDAINPGIYIIDSNNYIKINKAIAPQYLNLASTFTNSLVSATRTSGEVTNLCKITSATPNYFLNKGIKAGSTLFAIYDENNIIRGSGRTVVDVLTDSIIIDQEDLILDDPSIKTLHFGNEPFFKFLGYEANIQKASKNAELRYGNKSKVRMEIRYGKDDTLFKLTKVYIDYLKSPQFIRLTQDQIDTVEDTSQILEFPDYVCQELVNDLTKLLMENGSDPRLQTNIPINQTIANPQQQQK